MQFPFLVSLAGNLVDQRTKDVTAILAAGVEAVRPVRLFQPLLAAPPFPELRAWLSASNRSLLTIGKAALPSAETILENVSCGTHFILAPEAYSTGKTPLNIHFGSHPIPSEKSYQSARELTAWLSALPNETSLLVVLSGGTSALMSEPQDGISLEDKMAVNRLLIRSGATIHEINAVRKHLSKVKGGRLAQRVGNRRCLVLVISDVIGDDFSTIGSGPFYPDPSTYMDVRQILQKYAVWSSVPFSVQRTIQIGVEGKIDETPKPAKVAPLPHFIIASNKIAREASAREARTRGYEAQLLEEPLAKSVNEAVNEWHTLTDSLHERQAIIGGGEITLQVGGAGTGGRNQHLALLLTKVLTGKPIIFAAVGTDGVDGNSDAAGAWTSGETYQRAGTEKWEKAVREFDSFHYFNALGQAIKTGSTGTNVMDLYIALR